METLAAFALGPDVVQAVSSDFQSRRLTTSSDPAKAFLCLEVDSVPEVAAVVFVGIAVAVATAEMWTTSQDRNCSRIVFGSSRSVLLDCPSRKSLEYFREVSKVPLQ